MKKLMFNWLAVLMAVVLCAGVVSCKEDDEELPEGVSGKDHDATLYGEWIYDNGNQYVYDYYCFYSDGTGIHGSYEPDIDWVNEDDDITWYTENDRFLYIDGTKYEYSCDGSTFEITIKGKLRHYYEK